MQNLIAWARSNSWIRIALAILGGILAAVALYAWNKHLDKRHRREIAIVGGVAAGIIIWLLLGPLTAPASGTATLPNIEVGGSSVGGFPLNIGPAAFTGSINLGGYDPSVIFNNPKPPATGALCGCSERADVWGAFILQLWNTLDEIAPLGPLGVAPASNSAPTSTGINPVLPAPLVG